MHVEGDLPSGPHHLQSDGHPALCGVLLHVDLQAEGVLDGHDIFRQPEFIWMDFLSGTVKEEEEEDDSYVNSSLQHKNLWQLMPLCKQLPIEKSRLQYPPKPSASGICGIFDTVFIR